MNINIHGLPVKVLPPRNKINFKDFEHKQALPEHAKVVVEEPCVIVDAKGDPKIVVAQASEDFCKRIYLAVNSIKNWVTGRRASGMVNTSKIFGFQPRNPMHRQNFCTSAGLKNELPKVHHELEIAAEELEIAYKALSPKAYAFHKEQIEQVLPEWRIGNTVFTSGIINNDNALTYHYDRGNFRGVWSNMIVLKNQVQGGDLVCPEHDLMIKLPDRSVIFFDGQSLLHGVTPFKKKPNGHRYSIVYYSLEEMKKCLIYPEELKKAKQYYSTR